LICTRQERETQRERETETKRDRDRETETERDNTPADVLTYSRKQWQLKDKYNNLPCAAM